jgi:hypothetical protein
LRVHCGSQRRPFNRRRGTDRPPLPRNRMPAFPGWTYLAPQSQPIARLSAATSHRHQEPCRPSARSLGTTGQSAATTGGPCQRLDQTVGKPPIERRGCRVPTAHVGVRVLHEAWQGDVRFQAELLHQTRAPGAHPSLRINRRARWV